MSASAQTPPAVPNPDKPDPSTTPPTGVKETISQSARSFGNAVLENIAGIAFAAILLGSWAAAIIAPLTQGQQLSIIAALITAPDHAELRGRVLKDGDGVDKAQVWVILTDARGNRDSPPATLTDDKGGFSVNPMPLKLGAEKIVESTIFAKKEVPASGDKVPTTLRGEEFLSVGETSQRRVQLSGLKLLPLPAIFLISTILAFMRPTTLKHIFAMVLAFLFTASMIVYLSLGLKYVNTIGRQGEVLSLGFASIYEGTYVGDVPAEWLISLTAAPPAVATPPSEPAATTAGAQGASPPNPAATVTPSTPVPVAGATPARLTRGFGAPLWVLLVAVLGAGVLTVGLIVSEINKGPKKGDEADIRNHMQAIVLHQFFILFAPVGAIFAYQLLVVSEAAGQPLTVALASLGAGASMNALLSRAVTYSTGLIQGFQDQGKETATRTTQTTATTVTTATTGDDSEK